MKETYEQLRDRRFKLWSQRRDLQHGIGSADKQLQQIRDLRDGLQTAVELVDAEMSVIDAKIVKLTVRKRP